MDMMVDFQFPFFRDIGFFLWNFQSYIYKFYSEEKDFRTRLSDISRLNNLRKKIIIYFSDRKYQNIQKEFLYLTLASHRKVELQL